MCEKLKVNECKASRKATKGSSKKDVTEPHERTKNEFKRTKRTAKSACACRIWHEYYAGGRNAPSGQKDVHHLVAAQMLRSFQCALAK